MDPEIRNLQIETAKAYAVAERLASELEATVAELLDHVGQTPEKESAPPKKTRSRKDGK